MIRRLRAAALLLPLLVLSVSACSGDDEGAAPQPTVTVTETVTPTADPTTATATPTPNPTPTETTPTEDAPPEVDLSQPPTTYDEALAHVEAAAGEEQSLSRFETPDGIYCVLESDFAPPSCELMTGAVPAPDVCGNDGPSQSVGRIEFTDGDPQPVCNSDTIREPGAPSLDVTGVATWTSTTITCAVEEAGVVCINPPASQGFFLGAGRYEVFGS